MKNNAVISQSQDELNMMGEKWDEGLCSKGCSKGGNTRLWPVTGGIFRAQRRAFTVFFTSDNWTQKWNALQVHAKFTGNTKLGGAIGCLEDGDTLQTEILKG